jgi:hypothetical protein
MPSGIEPGSCGLEYRLVEIPASLRDGHTDEPPSLGSFMNRRCHTTTFALWMTDRTKPQLINSSRPFSRSSGSVCSSSSYTASPNTSSYRVNGVIPGALAPGTAVPGHGHAVPDTGEDTTDLTAKTTVVALHHLPLLTRRTVPPHPSLKVKAEVQDSGRVWRREAWVHISTTEPLNPVRNRNRRRGIGRDQGWRGHRGGLVNPNRNRRLHPDGDRLRGLMMTGVKDPRTSVR